MRTLIACLRFVQHMAVAQAVDAFELITGVAPDAARMSRHFRQLVANAS
ncbi:shikimate 5-dehydrogenase [Gordonia bronchialis]|nr:shikimate 5-dehydrogenase [Gordonia bronchialis]